jgi:hypothetical protein
MNYFKWLKLTITIPILFLLIVVCINFYIDTYGVRLNLFAVNKKVDRIETLVEVNQHIYKPEYIFRYPDRFDSFIFGSSRTTVIDPAKICDRNFYNMSYSQGLPSEHLAILNTFVRKGIKIKTVIIGLDEFCFTIPPGEHEKQLLRIMHPSVTGRSLCDTFFTFFFRMPKLFEISNGMKLLFNNGERKNFLVNEKGLQLSWIETEKGIALSGKSLLTNDTIQSSPVIFEPKLVDEVFTQIEELILLSKKNNFSLIFFFNPINKNLYIKYADSLIPIKLRLASLTDFYDFSGLNPITVNNLDYYDDGHYRYFVGDMIVKKIFPCDDLNNLRDFGVLVTKKNVNKHIQNQKLEINPVTPY